MGDVTRDVRDEMFPYGVDTIRLHISFPPAPAPQGYNGRAWKMRPLRGWTGGAEWDAREAAAAAQGGGSDTVEMPRGQASEGGLARDVQIASGAQSSQGELSRGSVTQQAALGSHGDAGFRFERFQDPVEQSLAALAAAYPLPGDPKLAANSPRNTATDASGVPQQETQRSPAVPDSLLADGKTPFDETRVPQAHVLDVQFTTDYDYACKALGVDRKTARKSIHAAKKALDLRGDDDCTFDLRTGDILWQGEIIGNLFGD